MTTRPSPLLLPAGGAPAAGPPRRIVPLGAMWFSVVAPPIITLLLDKEMLRFEGTIWTWLLPLRALTAILVYTVCLQTAHVGVFNGLLARLDRRRWSRAFAIAVYAAAAAGTSLAVTIVLAPLVRILRPQMIQSFARLVLQAVLISYVWLGGAYAYKTMLRRVQEEQARAHGEQLRALDARVRLLQARTNPHFLFNSLNSVMSLIATDPDLAERMLGHLAALYRYALEGSERLTVPLGAELGAVGDYLTIEKIRFGDRLRYEVDVDEALLSLAMPPMLLQPLVENAVKHAVGGRLEGARVRVRGEARGADVRLFVEDDGPGPSRSSHRGTGTSLGDVRERLRLLYGDDGRLSTYAAPAGGFVAELRLPREGVA